jgi:hypothetical protein
MVSIISGGNEMTSIGQKLVTQNLILGLMVPAIVGLLAVSAVAQNEFDGVARENGNYCSLSLSTVITVFVKNSDNDLVDATGLTQCPGVTDVGISENVITPRVGTATMPKDNYFCFVGSAKEYYLEIGASQPPYKWLAESLRTREGIYDLEEFGAVKNTSLNNTYALKNAMVYIGSRPSSGGKLEIPNGVFKVSGPLPPSQPRHVFDTLPIVLPPRIQIDAVVENMGTVFKIGECTDFVTIRDLGLVTPSEGIGNPPQYQYRIGTKAIYATGASPKSSQHIVFSGLTIQGFEEGISVLGTDIYKDWQFDTVKLENSEIQGLYPIRIDTQNSDWQVSNTTINTMNNVGNTMRGIGIWIQRGGLITLDNIFGGAPKIPGSIINRSLRPEAFIKVSGPASLNIRASQTEETDNSIVYDFFNPFQDTERGFLTLTGNVFGDPILIKQSVAFVSTGNLYLSNTVQVQGVAQGGNSKVTQIYSYGDTFSGVTYQRRICEASVGVPMPYGIVYGIAPIADCRRDFYIYNDPAQDETNSIVVKTSQRKSGINDSEGLDHNNLQSPIRIVSPPVWDPIQLPPMVPGTRQFSDRLKYWSYVIRRNSSDGLLEFEGNQKPPDFSWGNYTGFRFFGNVYPSADGQFELGNSNRRWALVRAMTITPGDIILSDRVSGKELYKIHEDEKFIYFNDVRTGKELMRLDRDGNLILAGKIYQEGNVPPDKSEMQKKVRQDNK